MENRKKKTIYALCVVVCLAGAGLFANNVVKSFGGLGDTLSEYEFPGEHPVRLSEKGLYSIYHQYENPGAGGGEALSPGDASIVVSLRRGGEDVELQVPESKKRYSYMGRKGVKMLEFENHGPADYVIESRSRGAAGDFTYTLALERGFEMKRLKGILLSQAFLLFPTLFAIVLFMRTYIRG